jgi:hypothetical protein
MFRGLAAVLTILSAALLLLYVAGPAQCTVPIRASLSLYGPPMMVRPALCAVEAVLPIWLVASAGLWFGLSYVLLVRGPRVDRPKGPAGS